MNITSKNGSRQGDKGQAPIDPAEWDAQERGLRASRLGRPEFADGADASYRRVADALRSQPLGVPPHDFAASVAARVEAGARFERSLTIVLAMVLAATALVTLAIYGGSSWSALQQAFGHAAMAWVMAGLGCVGLSWVFGQGLVISGQHGTARQ